MSRFPALTLVFCFAAALLLFPPSSTCRAQEDSASDNSSAVEEIEDIKDIEEIEEIDAVELETEPAGLFQTLGRFHPVVLHFPIAWLLLLLLAEVVVLTGLGGLAGELRRWTLPLLVLTLLSFIPAIVSGLGMASGHGSAAAEFVERMLLHRNFNIAAGVVLLSALAVRRLTSQAAGSKTRLVYFFLVLAAAGLMGYGSHLGGVMVWGEGFLPVPF